MLICTEGRERTRADDDELLRRAGFREVAGRRTAPPPDVVLATQ